MRDDLKLMVTAFIDVCNRWDEGDVLDLLDVCEARFKMLRAECEQLYLARLTKGNSNATKTKTKNVQRTT